MESALIEHEAVKESAVVASPDVDRGQVRLELRSRDVIVLFRW